MGRQSSRLSRGWKLATAALVIVAGASVGVRALADDDDHGEVVRVIDGDTLVARIDGQETTVRLLNVDTPETKHPDLPVQCQGPEATAFLTQRLPTGTNIDLEYDEERTDRYRRTLAGVRESGSLVNAEIAAVGLGLPVVFEPNERFYDEVRAASRTAESQGKGLFSPEIECTPAALVQQTGQAVGAIPAVASGDPAAAVEQATVAEAAAEKLVVDLGPEELPGLGLSVFASEQGASYMTAHRHRATVLRDAATTRRAELGVQQVEFQAEQKRQEDARIAEEQTQRDDRAAATDRSRSGEPTKTAPSTAPRAQGKESTPSRAAKDRSSTRAPEATRATRGSDQKSTPSAEPTAASERSQAPSPSPVGSGSGGTSSSCTPYGPEIPYSADGGYTGKRHGMPGGKTFRKCS